MVKKLKYLLFFIPFLFITNVNAYTMPQPTSLACFDYGECLTRENTSLASYQDRNIYWSPYKMGGVSSQEYIKNMDFVFSNVNLCSNQDLSISGVLASIYGFFTEQSYTLHVYSGNNELTCSTSPADPYHSINFACYGKGGGTLSITLQQNSYSLISQYSIGVSQEMNVSCDVSNEAIVNQSITNTQNIINNQNSNTNQIIQNQDGNTQDIIDNQNSNTQDIIDNQNSNTEKEIESQKVCNTIIIDKNYVIQEHRYVTNTGEIGNTNNSYGVTDFLDISNVTNIKNLSSTDTGNFYFCTYNSNKEKVSCYSRSSYLNQSISITNNEKYVRFTINIPINQPQFEYTQCKNGNQALSDSITSEEPPNTSSELNNLDNSVASDTPISDLITLPITLLNVFINGMESNCTPANLGNLYGTDLILPCINIEQRLGSNLWSTIDILFSIFMCYNIGMLFVSAFSGITSLRDDFDSLYQPRHADTGYQPKHGG